MSHLRRASIMVLVVATVLMGACSGGDPASPSPSSRRVNLVARVVHGPSVQSGAALQNLMTSGFEKSQSAAIDYWGISPDQARITISTLTFTDASGQGQQVDLTNCVVTYARSTPSLTRLLDCPFTITAGTYVALGVGILNDFEVLVDDAANGFFSDPAAPGGIARTRPSSGAQFIHYHAHLSAGAGNKVGSATYLTTPLVIDSGSAPTITLVADMIHTMFLSVAGGVASIDTLRPAAPVELVPSATGAGKVEFYSSSGTALNVRMPGETDADSRSVRIFYANPPQPSYVFSPLGDQPSQAFNISPAKSPSFGGQRAGGYLGVDGSGVLCFALPKDNFSYTQYSIVRRMPLVSTLGASTVVTGQHILNAPAPVSGDTYSSGCPTIVPDESYTVYLVAR